MLGSLKDKWFSLQDDIASSVKNLAPASVQTGHVIWSSTSPNRFKGKNLQAGGELLNDWQACWEELHLANERNIKKANRCEKVICDIRQKTRTQWSQVMTLQTLIGQSVPQVGAEIQTAMKRLSQMESLFEEVEISLLALEESVEARELQEKQLEEKFQLTMHQERKRVAFNELSGQLQLKFDGKKEAMEQQRRREKQELYQTLFEQDMEAHRGRQGNAPHQPTNPHSTAQQQTHNKGGRRESASDAASNFLRLPIPLHDPDASLETVDLNDDPNDQTLEKFLRDEDLLYDVSPLPKDDDSSNQTLLDEEIDNSCSLKENLQSELVTTTLGGAAAPTLITNTQKVKTDCNNTPLQNKERKNSAIPTPLPIPTVTMTSSESVAESLYFTPDTSANEKLSELA